MAKRHLKAVKRKVKGYTAKRYVALLTPAQKKEKNSKEKGG